MLYLRRTLVLALLLVFAGNGFSQATKFSPTDLRDGPKMRLLFRPVIAKASEATVRVQADGADVGFGTIVDPNGWIIAKWSEIKDARVTVKLKNGTMLNAEVKGVKDDVNIEGAYDLALLKVNAKDLKAVEWRDSKEAKVGKWVASPGVGLDPVALGVVSVATRKFKLNDQPPRFSNFNSGWLGVQLDAGDGGAKITVISPKSPAEKAGLKKDDLVYEAAGRPIADTETLINTIGKFKPGEKVLLKLKRGDEDRDIEVTLGIRPKELQGNPQETMGTKLSNRRGGFPVILQHDSGVRPEDCGGPLVDLDGKTVGINIARGGRTETFAIPAENIQALLPDLKSGKLAREFKPRVPNFTMRSSFIADDSLDKKRAKQGKYYTKVENVKLVAGSTYVIEMYTSADTVDPYVFVEDEEGKELAKDDDGGGFPNAKIVFRAPSDGVYRIVCTTFNPNETGTYTLSVRRQVGSKVK